MRLEVSDALRAKLPDEVAQCIVDGTRPLLRAGEWAGAALHVADRVSEIVSGRLPAEAGGEVCRNGRLPLLTSQAALTQLYSTAPVVLGLLLFPLLSRANRSRRRGLWLTLALALGAALAAADHVLAQRIGGTPFLAVVSIVLSGACGLSAALMWSERGRQAASARGWIGYPILLTALTFAPGIAIGVVLGLSPTADSPSDVVAALLVVSLPVVLGFIFGAAMIPSEGSWQASGSGASSGHHSSGSSPSSSSSASSSDSSSPSSSGGFSGGGASSSW